MRGFALVTAMALLGACESNESPVNESTPASDPAENEVALPVSNGHVGAGTRWELQSSGEGTALALLSASGSAEVRLYCPSGKNQLLVNVADFRPIGSEERMSFGSGGEVTALVADPRGDAQRGGVSGTGEVPANLAALIGGPLSVSYGAQTSGPHSAPAQQAGAFVAACREAVAAGPDPTPGSVSPCLMQGSERLQVRPLRAVGTEPFWGARIEGRCVTYSHPDDQEGTRVWTRYTPGTNDGGTWTGNLGGKKFELRARPQAGCSDGMSDRIYPIAVELVVAGEERRGCAERL